MCDLNNSFLKPFSIIHLHCGRSAVPYLTKMMTEDTVWLLQDTPHSPISPSPPHFDLPPFHLLPFSVTASDSRQNLSLSWGPDWLLISARETDWDDAAAEHALARGDAGVYQRTTGCWCRGKHRAVFVLWLLLLWALLDNDSLSVARWNLCKLSSK